MARLGKIAGEELNPDSQEVGYCLTIDRMAKRYGKLPSEIIRDATTFDLQCLDVTMSWVAYQRHVQEHGRPPTPKLSVDQMLEQMKKAKERANGKSS